MLPWRELSVPNQYLAMAKFKLWQNYTRKQIAAELGYQSDAATHCGVVCPKNTNKIWLFVTRKQQTARYNNSIYANILLWEGQKGHRTDQRIINSPATSDKIFLFFRAKHHQELIYFGRIRLLKYERNTTTPSRFVFEIEALSPQSEKYAKTTTSIAVTDPGPTGRIALRTERIGQANWRSRLLQLWDQSCSVTLLKKEKLLRASHIKPWRHCSDKDRLHQYNGLILNPSLDCLFDCGFITFRHNRGRIKISNVLSEQDREILGVYEEMSLRKAFSKNKEYLEYHNDCVFEKWMKASELQRTLSL